MLKTTYSGTPYRTYFTISEMRMNTIAKDLKSSNNVVGAEDYDGQKDNERDEEDWLQLHVSQKN